MMSQKRFASFAKVAEGEIKFGKRETQIPSPARDYDQLVKILLVGDAGVGKLSLMLRFADETFEEHSRPIGVDFKIRTIELDGIVVKLQIWNPTRVPNAYYRGAHCILMVCDVTNRESFDNLKVYLNGIDRYATEGVPKMVVGNKSDLGDRRQVDSTTAAEFCSGVAVPYLEMSAKSGENVQQAFETATRLSLLPRNLHAVGLGEALIALKCLTNAERKQTWSLDLGWNSLSEIPADIFLCENLTNLDLSGNYLSMLPVGLLRLQRLSSLVIKDKSFLVDCMPNRRSYFDAKALRLYFAEQFVRASILTCVMASRFRRDSLWGLISRDVMRMLVRFLWMTRHDCCWINEACIASLEERQKRDVDRRICCLQ